MSGYSDRPMGDDEKRWRRRSLYALILLIPLVIAVNAYDTIHDWWIGRDRLAKEIAVDASADFGGSQWRLSKFRMLPVPAGDEIPDGAMLVLAQFEVQVQQADLPKDWRDCAISLESPDGRRWSSTDAVQLPRSEARPCTRTMYADVKPGSTVQVREVFLAPREGAESLRVTVSLQPQQPHYLRFAQPPQLMQMKP